MYCLISANMAPLIKPVCALQLAALSLSPFQRRYSTRGRLQTSAEVVSRQARELWPALFSSRGGSCCPRGVLQMASLAAGPKIIHMSKLGPAGHACRCGRVYIPPPDTLAKPKLGTAGRFRSARSRSGAPTEACFPSCKGDFFLTVVLTSRCRRALHV